MPCFIHSLINIKKSQTIIGHKGAADQQRARIQDIFRRLSIPGMVRIWDNSGTPFFRQKSCDQIKTNHLYHILIKMLYFNRDIIQSKMANTKQ